MPRVQAFSSVSVVDLTDVGVINFYLTSNLPNSVIYDPNANSGTGSYTPNWANSTLQITPVISYNGQNLSLTASGLVIEFLRKEGTSSAGSLSTGETVTSGVLNVTANKIASVTSGQLTYVCNITYTAPDTGVPISAQASLTFNKVTMATNLKSAYIIGESAFLYNQSREIVGTGIITLTADLTNCGVSQWQYKNSNGEFVPFPTTYNQSISGTTLSVRHNEENIWLNNNKTAIIKLVTDANNIYDIMQIVKIYDGTPGDATIAAVLTNDNHTVPVDSTGSPKSPSSWASAASTQIYIYEGGDDVTNQWTIQVTNGSGLEGTYNSSTHVYTPSSLSSDSSYALFSCTRTGYDPITKRYTISRQYSGADGQDAVIYEVVPDAYAMNLDLSGNYTPDGGVTFTAYKQIGNKAKATYSGRFKIFESTDGENFTQQYASGSNEYSYKHNPSSNNVVAIKCILYESGNTNVQLDEQTVVITRDGQNGIDGASGTDGLSMGLGNYSDVIPCTTGGRALAQRDITIPFYAYKGITRVVVQATVGTPLPDGVSVYSNNDGTSSTDGVVVLRVAQNANFSGDALMTGDINITLTAEGRSVGYKYNWVKNKQAANGENAVFLQLQSPGTVEINRDATVTAKLYSGTETVTPARIEWAKWESGDYTTISGQTSASITITESMVTDYMWLKCSTWYPTYNSTDPSINRYDAYCTVDDITDPISAVTRATITEFKNSQGFGAIYTLVFRGGEEVDPIKSRTFSDVAPTGASSGDYYYHLNSTNKTCILKKYNGTAWVDVTSEDDDIYAYRYYRVNNRGESVDTNTAWADGGSSNIARCRYIDPSVINGRMQFICEVSEKVSS